MKGKKKTTIEITPKDVESIIRAYFVNEKNIVIQNVDFNIEHTYFDHTDTHGSPELKSVICTREDDIKI